MTNLLTKMTLFPHERISIQKLWGMYTIDTFQDFLIAEHIKPRIHVLEISILSLKCVVVRPTKTPKSADKKMAQF